MTELIVDDGADELELGNNLWWGSQAAPVPGSSVWPVCCSASSFLD